MAVSQEIRSLDPSKYENRPNILQAALTKIGSRNPTMLMRVPFTKMTRGQALEGFKRLRCVNVRVMPGENPMLSRAQKADATQPLEDKVVITWKFDVRAIAKQTKGLISADCTACSALKNCILVDAALNPKR